MLDDGDASGVRSALERSAWASLSLTEKLEIGRRLVALLGTDFRPAGPTGQTVSVWHRPSGVRLCVIPGGSFEMGYGARELALVRERIRRLDEDLVAIIENALARAAPARTVTVSPFLLSAAPITKRAWHRLGLAKPRAAYQDGSPFAGIARAVPEPPAPFRLPSEAEWEYAMRGGQSGALMPSGFPPIGDGTQLRARYEEAWSDALETGAAPTSHVLGLQRAGFERELCADAWHPSHAGAPASGEPRGGHPAANVVRPGLDVDSIPWQVAEWISATCAYREPRVPASASHKPLCFRLAMSLERLDAPRPLLEPTERREPVAPTTLRVASPPERAPSRDRSAVRVHRRLFLFDGVPERAVDETFARAVTIARERAHVVVEPIHLLMALLERVPGGASAAIERCSEELDAIPSEPARADEAVFGARAVRCAKLSLDAVSTRLVSLDDPGLERARAALGALPPGAPGWLRALHRRG